MPPDSSFRDLTASSRLVADGGATIVSQELQRIFYALDRHFTNLSAVELDLSRTAGGASVYYGLDFSDIYTFMHPFQRNTRHTRLVNIEVEGLENLVLMPGALAELLVFLRGYGALRPDATDSTYLSAITSSDEARAFVAAYEVSPVSDSTAVAAARLLGGFPLVRAIADGRYAGSTLSRLSALIGRLVPFDQLWGRTDDLLDYEVYAHAWRSLTRARPERPILSNKVDAFNYALAAGVSKKSNSGYLALSTCSFRPYRAFRAIQWDEDPMRSAVLQETYNFSFVRSPVEATYKVLLESHARKNRQSALNFARQARGEIYQLHERLRREFPMLERWLKSPSHWGEEVAARATGLINDILSLQQGAYRDYIDQVASEVDRDVIADKNQELYSDLHRLLSGPADKFGESLRFSFDKLSDAYQAFTDELGERVPGMIAEAEGRRLVSIPAQARAYRLRVEPDPEHGIGSIFVNGDDRVAYLEAAEVSFSAYWPIGVDVNVFLRAAQESSILTNFEDIATRVPTLPNKRFSAGIVLAIQSGERIVSSWDLEESLFKAIDRLLGERELAISASVDSVRINTPYFDLWCDVQTAPESVPCCGIMSHWRCTEVLSYLISQTSFHYIPHTELESALKQKLGKYPALVDA